MRDANLIGAMAGCRERDLTVEAIGLLPLPRRRKDGPAGRFAAQFEELSAEVKV
jgi:hypothetical protein